MTQATPSLTSVVRYLALQKGHTGENLQLELKPLLRVEKKKKKKKKRAAGKGFYCLADLISPRRGKMTKSGKHAPRGLRRHHQGPPS